MIRAFIAVEIDLPNKKTISETISNLKKSKADVKWANETQMHLTLKFLGNIEEKMTQEISNILNSIAKNFNVFNIKLRKIGAFPNTKKPRVIWLGIDEGRQELKSLAAKIESSLENIGFQKEKREYKAHLTLGRVKSSKNLSQLTALIEQIDFQSQDQIKINKLILFQSTLSPKGATYTPLSTLNLTNQQ